MKVRVIKTGEILEVMDYNDSQVEVYRDDFTEFLAQNIYGRDEVELLFNESEKAVIEGYVARDKDGEILISKDKPFEDVIDDGTIAGHVEWVSDGFIHLITDSFPSIDCKSNPQRVRIEITLIDEKG